MKRACGIMLLVVIAGVGCATLDRAASKERITSRVTVFVRNNEGDVQSVELRKTESGIYIGPDGKAFRSRPSDEVLAARYAK